MLTCGDVRRRPYMPELQEFIFVIRPTRLEMLTEGPTEREAGIIGEHFGYLKGLTEQGVMAFVGRTLNADAETFGIAVFRAASVHEARGIMLCDPAVRQGVMSATLYPFKIVLQGR